MLITANSKLKSTLLLLVVGLLIGSCHKDPPSPPTKVDLTFPAQNSLCTSGTIVSPTQSTVIFTWSIGANTNSYDFTIKNLVTGVSIVQSTTVNQLSITLQRNTPYSWFVTSKSNLVAATAQSDVWKFYLAGEGAVSYSPFPATINSPSFGAVLPVSGTVNLTWTGSDVDNDIVGYDVYFGTVANSLPMIKNNISEMFANNITVNAGNTYYWKVITRDLQGNTSDSGVYQFKVN